MKIQSAHIDLSSHRKSTVKDIRQSSLKVWIGNRPPDLPGAGTADRARLSEQARQAQPVRRQAEVGDENLTPMDDLKSKLVRMLLKILTGRDFKLFNPSELTPAASASATSTSAGQTSAPPPSAGYGLEFDDYASHYEYEAVSFSVQGTIQTQDGQSIPFSVDLNMSREFYSEQSQSLRAGDARKVDPLVLNFEGAAAQLTGTKFAFDLDSDGRSEQISGLAPGSGWVWWR